MPTDHWLPEMKRTGLIAAIVLTVLVGLPAARAENPQVLFDGCRWSFPRLDLLWQQRKCWCPDDYCRKPLPCPPPRVGGCGFEDYCAKPMPCVPANPKGCVDDYCPKNCPILLGPTCEPWYTCGPQQNCSKSGN